MFPRHTLHAVICVLSLGVAGSFADAATTGAHYLRVRLQPSRASGAGAGYAVLEPAGNRTGVDVVAGRLPSGVVAPVHLYTYLVEGRCANRTSRSGYALDHVTSQQAPISSAGMAEVQGHIPLAFDQLRRRDYALSVRLSPADGGRELLCGDV